MRAISLWQPWASAIALGTKRIETRHWSTAYRGPLAIHAAKKFDRDQREFASTERTLGRLPAQLPLGAVVAVCRLTACLPSEDLLADRAQFNLTAIEKLYGNYGDGRFGWILEDITALDAPIPYRGGQSFFTVPDELLPAAIRKAYA